MGEGLQCKKHRVQPWGQKLTSAGFTSTVQKCTGFPEPASVMGAGFYLQTLQKV